MSRVVLWLGSVVFAAMARVRFLAWGCFLDIQRFLFLRLHRGYSTAKCFKDGLVAQLVARQTPDQKAKCSNRFKGRVYFKKNLELHIQGCYEGNVCLTGGGSKDFYPHIGDRIMVWLGGRIGKRADKHDLVRKPWGVPQNNLNYRGSLKVLKTCNWES